MKNLSIKIAAMCFMAIIACPCVMADEKIDLDMVKIPGKNFEMLRTEVTQELYESVMGENPSWFCRDNKELDKDVLKKLNKSTSDYPVEQISWYDAIYFCNKLSEKKGLCPVYAVDGETNVLKWDYNPHNEDEIDGKITQDIFADGYRLPTFDECLYAAEGGENYMYSGSDDIDKVAWYDGNSNGVTHPVAQKKSNGYGLYDMNGNVWEWCWDTYGYNDRFVYGGSWYYYCQFRTVELLWWKAGSYGFRIVRTIK